uniref:Uncharacterized protein n=1 Tax=Eptatretus burgeri TaxID=7764 RepID=A0A8C4Q8N7_EPTBU
MDLTGERKSETSDIDQPLKIAIDPQTRGDVLPAVTVVQLPGGQSVQVQSVIHASQPSVIQPPQIHTVQVASSESNEPREGAQGNLNAQKRREVLSRRPSYRKILNELSDTDGVTKEVEGNGEEGGETPVAPSVSGSTPVPPGQYIAIAEGGTLQLAIAGGAETGQGLQAIPVPGGAMPAGATVLQYAQTSDIGPLLFPSSSVVVQSASGSQSSFVLSSASSSPSLVEETSRKREIRLMKNREAARECRRKKKEYVMCLENRVAVLENQNKTLIEELKALKDLYCNKTS